MSSRTRLGWDPFFDGQLGAEWRECRIARVVEEQRGLSRIAGDVAGWAEVSGRFRHAARSAADFPAIGDWLAVTGDASGDRFTIVHRFERRSAIVRRAAGTAAVEQVIAANVDTIFLVTAMAGDLNPHRLDRYLTMVWESGAVPVIVLTKADLVDDPAAVLETARLRLPLVDLVMVRALDDDGLGSLAPYLRPGSTLGLIGSSGVGKSTIVNRLLGREQLRVGDVRSDDGRGRHTTTARHLVELPNGALLIDTPGMRELQLWADDASVDGAFADIAALAAACRFADCGHETEPGCAVRAAVEEGRLAPDRLTHYRHLQREVAFEARKQDVSAALEEKRRWKQIHRAQRALYRLKGRE